MSPVILEVDGARKRFGETVALDRLSLTLRSGEKHALLGPNGAGKTSLIRAISGRLKLDDGAIRWRMQNARLGVAPQEIALYPRLTAEENLQVFAALQGVPKATARTRIDELLAWTGLNERSREPIGGFSGGMKRRLNIACAVVHEPHLVLLDEPTVGVDPQSREKIWAMLDDMNQRGMTLLVTTHMLEEAENICDQITIMDAGKILETGTMATLVKKVLGSGQLLHFTLDKPLPAPETHHPIVSRLKASPTGWVLHVEDWNDDLANLLAWIDGRARIVDMSVEKPSLHQIFVTLTGRALRDD
jgi:ABC-2 type transport system ATP-binding protein